MNVFVTGGTRGIGSAIVKRFAYAENGNVLYNYVNSKELSDELSKNPRLRGFQCDMRDSNSCRDLANRILEEYGEINVLVNNAGITCDKTFAKMSRNDWRDVLEVNLLSVFDFTQTFYNNMREKNSGCIINISSIVGQKGSFGQANYAASKAGIIGFTKALALEGATKNITVNAIAPGYIDTDMAARMPKDVLATIKEQIPLKHLGKKENIAEFVFFLTTDAGRYFTGQVFGFNGGLYT
jgi:acetoacetyl-CoA reductase